MGLICTIVYGPNDSHLRPAFWAEMKNLRHTCARAWIKGNDFNITRFASEKIGGEHNQRDREVFNETITNLKLVDPPINGRLFTWSDMREHPNIAKLDRNLILEEWDSKFTQADCIVLKCPTSDHIPICVYSREGTQVHPRRFCFVKWWLKHQEVHDLIKESWSDRTSATATGNLYIKLC